VEFILNRKQLGELIKLGEGFTIEFKKSGTRNLGRELCAFANATGGSLLIGVADDGKVVGVKGHNRLKSEIQATARSVEPPLVLDIESVGKVLVVFIPAQNSKPYSFGGKFYLRDGASSQQMSREEIREFFFKEGVIHFDETPCDAFKLNKDLKAANWNLFAKRANIPDDMKPEIALENLHLVKDKKITQAGAWLLADDITRFNISGNVSCALFMGSDKARILDRKDFSSDVYSMIDSVMAYILSKINTELIIEKVKREERPELPEEALREAVVNALAHRDYRSTANVQVYIFQDRVEIVSPGGLPAGMTEDDLGKKSIPRNPLLFGILYRMNVVEHIGSGIKRIHEACKDYGVDAPTMQVEDSWVTVVFQRSAAEKRATDQDTMQGTMQGTMQVTREKEIVLFCQTPKSRKEIQDYIKISNRDYFRKQILNPLIKKGLLKLTIPEKPNSPNQKYFATESIKK
jgi:ATP-dependent DNA helicase RecG